MTLFLLFFSEVIKKLSWEQVPQKDKVVSLSNWIFIKVWLLFLVSANFRWLCRFQSVVFTDVLRSNARYRRLDGEKQTV